jgi:hypothetical protein
MHPYTCPTCNAEVLAERFTDTPVTCPHCGAGPFVTQHECHFGEDEWCEDWLEGVDAPAPIDPIDALEAVLCPREVGVWVEPEADHDDP